MYYYRFLMIVMFEKLSFVEGLENKPFSKTNVFAYRQSKGKDLSSSKRSKKAVSVETYSKTLRKTKPRGVFDLA